MFTDVVNNYVMLIDAKLKQPSNQCIDKNEFYVLCYTVINLRAGIYTRELIYESVKTLKHIYRQS